MNRLFKYTLTLVLSCAIVGLTLHNAGAWQRGYVTYKIPSKSVISSYLETCESDAMLSLRSGEIDYFDAGGLEEAFNQSNPNYTADVYVTSIRPGTDGNAVNALSPGSTVVVVTISMVVLGIVIYVVYKVIKRLDQMLTNTIHKDDSTVEELTLITPQKFRLLSEKA